MREHYLGSDYQNNAVFTLCMCVLFSDKQDTETSELVRQQQQVLKEAQARAKEKASQLESVVTDYETKLKVTTRVSL